MRIGICSDAGESVAAAAAGWDYVEASVQSLLRGFADDAEWEAMRGSTAAAALPVLAANCLVPGELKITGPGADLEGLAAYVERVVRRAKMVGIGVLVFGSGAARHVPEGFDRVAARRQIVEFGRGCADVAAEAGITVVIEALNRGECNIINSLDEAMAYVREIDRPNVGLVLDTYHFWVEEEPLASLAAAVPYVRHVHVADKEGRVAPGLSGRADYRGVFSLLKRGGYDRLMSFEGAAMDDFATTGPRVVQYLKDQWDAA